MPKTSTLTSRSKNDELTSTTIDHEFLIRMQNGHGHSLQAKIKAMREDAVPVCVLVCEDEQFIRWALSEHLRSCGYEVLEAENGVECVEAAKKSTPQAILLDLRMPKMDGATALRELRELGLDMPVYILTGFGRPGSHSEAIELGANGFIQKPYQLSEISELLETLFSSPAN